MKTADFIPLILLELNSGNKYGLEITKSIEKRSSGRIVIKQPTLYAILKKLEKSKLISSYWLDSDIGGKRHYYKITQMGKMQAAAYPNYNEVIRQFLEKEDRLLNPEKYQNVQITMLDNFPTTQTAPKETVLPTQEVFATNNIDTATTNDLNKQNANFLQPEKRTKAELFASNNEVSQFTKKEESKISTEYKEQLKSIYEATSNKFYEEDTQFNLDNYNNIKYVDYVDLHKNPKYIYAKKTAKNMFYRVLSTCIFLLLAMIITSIPVRFSGDASVYYIALIISVLCLIFYPTLLAFNYQSFRLKCEEHPYKFNLKKQLSISTIILIVVIVLFILLNITMLDISLSEVFNSSNFVNFYAPIIISLAMYADCLFGYIFLIKNNK